MKQDSSECSSHREIFLFLGKLKKGKLRFLSLCCGIYKLQHQETILHRRADIVQVGVLKNLTSSTGKHLCWSLILIKLRTPPMAASGCRVFTIEHQITRCYRESALLLKYQLSYISLRCEDCLKLLGNDAFAYFSIENNF